MTANTTFYDTANNLLDIFTGINTNVPSFPYFILGALAIVIYLTNINEDIKRLMVVEGFYLSIFTGLFIALGWLPISILYLTIFIFCAGVFTTLFIKKDY